jgi:hypothetical protein
MYQPINEERLKLVRNLPASYSIEMCERESISFVNIYRESKLGGKFYLLWIVSSSFLKLIVAPLVGYSLNLYNLWIFYISNDFVSLLALILMPCLKYFAYFSGIFEGFYINWSCFAKYACICCCWGSFMPVFLNSVIPIFSIKNSFKCFKYKYYYVTAGNDYTRAKYAELLAVESKDLVKFNIIQAFFDGAPRVLFYISLQPFNREWNITSIIA